MRKTILMLALLALVSTIPAAADTFTLGLANAPTGFAPGSPGNFGQITKDRGPREIQYALKFTF